jgi:AraC family transcriptional regulator
MVEIRREFRGSRHDLELLLPPANQKTADWRALRLRRFIDDHDGHLGCSLGGLCRQLDLGITPSHASRVFRSALGIGVREYMKRIRLDAAGRKLESTSLSIKEIAADLGYKSPADLFRQFKQAFRITPKRYRDLRRSCENDQGSGSDVASMSDEEPCIA